MNLSASLVAQSRVTPVQRLRRLLLGGLGGVWLAGCASHPSSYTPDYQQALQQVVAVQPTPAQAQALAERFVATFSQLGRPEFLTAVQELYAPTLYSNDTLAIYHHRSGLMRHFVGMNQRVSAARVQLVSQTLAGERVYVHWDMAYDLKFLGQTRSMHSYGVSELKMNAQGQVVFQQDYWDPNNGLFRQLPWVGGLYAAVLPFRR